MARPDASARNWARTMRASPGSVLATTSSMACVIAAARSWTLLCRLTRDELPGPFKGRFDGMDTNGDGFADEAELEAAAGRMARMMGG